MRRSLFLASLMLCVTLSAWAQKPNKLGKIAQSVSAYTQNKSKLTLATLGKATTISYHCGNGSVAPDYHYDCYIHVIKNNVNVTIYGGYDGEVKFNENRYISQAEYKQFLNKLANQNIRKTPSNGNEFLCGAGASDITVKVKQQVIFEGDEDVNLSIGKGRLDDSFLPLLTETMEWAIRNPDKVISQLETDPIDINIP